MLVAILTFLLLGGGSSVTLDYVAESRGNAKDVIAHENRRKSALETMKAMEKLTKGFVKERRKAAKALGKAWKTHSGGYDEVDAVWQAHFDTVDVYYGEMLDLREELKGSITREEWERIFRTE